MPVYYCEHVCAVYCRIGRSITQVSANWADGSRQCILALVQDKACEPRISLCTICEVAILSEVIYRSEGWNVEVC